MMIQSIVAIIIANVLFALTAIGLAVVAFLMTDRSAPADVIATWVVTKEIVPGRPFLIRYVIDTHDTCDRSLQHGFTQGSARYAMEPLPTAAGIEPEWQTTMYDAVAPLGMAPGPANYAATIFWRNCWLRPTSWFWPISKDVVYGLPVMVLSPL